MNETKNVDKICPFFGTLPVFMRAPDAKLLKVTVSPVSFDLVRCQEDHCELWDKSNERCSLSLLAWGMTSITVEVEGLSNAIKDIVEYVKTLKEKPHGNS